MRLFIGAFLLMGLALLGCRPEDACFGEPRGCACPAVVDTVCGCDGLEYGNACEADCAGTLSYTAGPCVR